MYGQFVQYLYGIAFQQVLRKPQIHLQLLFRGARTLQVLNNRSSSRSRRKHNGNVLEDCVSAVHDSLVVLISIHRELIEAPKWSYDGSYSVDAISKLNWDRRYCKNSHWTGESIARELLAPCPLRILNWRICLTRSCTDQRGERDGMSDDCASWNINSRDCCV